MRFLLVAGLAESLINFRGPLIAALQETGFEVHVAAPALPLGSSLRQQLESRGLTVHDVGMQRTGRNLLADLRTGLNLWRLIRCVRPTHLLSYTAKAVIYGSLAAWLARVPHRFVLITGLGYAFQDARRHGALRMMVQQLYSIALRRVHLVFFQNPDDEALFRALGILRPGTPSKVINGSGVDLVHFATQQLPGGAPRFLMIARLLGDKGVREYAQAARRIRAQHPGVRFALAGWLDENPDCIRHDELQAWIAEGTLTYLGRLQDVRPALAQCSVYVLPSYREGTPRTVLEAMALGRPVITTDAPGCRETVADGVNGFLVPVQSVDALVHTMQRFIEQPALIQQMGASARQIAEVKYDVHKVNALMLHEMALRSRPRMMLTTTVPETFGTILAGQPRWLAERFQVTLATSPGKMLCRVEQQERLPIVRLRMVRGMSPLQDLVSVFCMICVLRRQLPDLVHSYTPKAGLVTMLAAWLCGVPLRVHTFTGLIFPTAQGLRQRLLISVDRLICACATHVVPEGLGVKNDLERFRVTCKPLHVIGSGNIAGVDTAHFSPAAPGVEKAGDAIRAQLRLSADAFVFCFVGRLTMDKGLAEMIEAFVSLPPLAHLLLVGGVDERSPVGAQMMATVRAHPRMHMLGFVSDVRPYMRAAQVLILPSYREGFPNVVLQAGAMTLPVIATDINGCNEVVEPGFNGWLVPARDGQALHCAMQVAMHMPDIERKAMGLRGRDRVQQRFEQIQHWERMRNFYMKVLSDRPPHWPAGQTPQLMIETPHEAIS